MNLKFIDLLAILQLITTKNSSDGNNIKNQAIKRLLKLGFYTRLSKRQLINLCSALECTKNNTLRPLAQKGCAPLCYGMQFKKNATVRSNISPRI